MAIITAPADPDLAVLHHRVPSTIAPDDFDRWLDCSSDDAGAAMALLTAPAAGGFAWHEVSTRYNRAAHDDAQLVLPITAEQMAADNRQRRSPRRSTAAASDDGQGLLF